MKYRLNNIEKINAYYKKSRKKIVFHKSHLDNNYLFEELLKIPSIKLNIDGHTLTGC